MNAIFIIDIVRKYFDLDVKAKGPHKRDKLFKKVMKFGEAYISNILADLRCHTGSNLHQ